MKYWIFAGLGVIVLGGAGIGWYMFKYADIDPYKPMYVAQCGGCHGDALQGTADAVALVNRELKGGDSVDALQDSIRSLHPELRVTLSDLEIKGMAIFVGERRLGQKFIEFQFDHDITVPEDVQHSEAHDFVVETIAEGLAPLIFSIEPLPDGSLLVTEKERGMSIVSADGVQSALIEGTPQTGHSFDMRGIQYGWGWLLDVSLHPDYADNGWIYLHYTDLCGDHCEGGITEVSMNRVDRGRIVDGRWVDVETIWRVPYEMYRSSPDTAAGGRIAHDGAGHVYLAIGAKGEDGESDVTPQDLTLPYGKIHRVHDDGSIPLDNPFAVSGGDGDADRPMPSIWTYGHRSPQGLEWNPQRQAAWNSEMGPRGGDELNELLPGRNYGWPYHSFGLEYSKTYVERHKRSALEFDVSEVETTMVDITPSPAISSFVLYSGAQFPGWQDDVLIGSLKGMSLYRMVFEGNKIVHQETVIRDMGRIRDVEVGYDGLVYLLLESEDGSSIVRLKPVDERSVARL